MNPQDQMTLKFTYMGKEYTKSAIVGNPLVDGTDVTPKNYLYLALQALVKAIEYDIQNLPPKQ